MSLHPQQECKQLSNLVLLLEDGHAEITKGPFMPCRHADCQGIAWHIVTIGLSVHHFRLGELFILAGRCCILA